MIAVTIAAVAQAAIFAPPLGVPIRVVNTRAEGDWHFRMERLVRFAREGSGYRAEVWMVGAHADGPERVSAMMEAGYSGLAGRAMVFHLDGAGKLLSIDDLDGLWMHFCDGVAAIIRTKRPNPEPLVAPLRALSPAQRSGILASLVTALFADEAGEPTGTRTIRLPAKSPYGEQVMLPGTRTIERLGITQRSTTRAAADVAPSQGVPGHVEMEVMRESDPATGLITTMTETVRNRVGDTVSQRVSTARVTIEPATPWPAT